LTDTEKLSMDLNANVKKRIVEKNSTIQQIFQNEQSKMIKKLQDMKFVSEAVPQLYVDDFELLFLFNYNFYPWLESIKKKIKKIIILFSSGKKV
jgi:hypothetical protein